MSLYYAKGSATTDLSSDELRAALGEVLDGLGPREKVLAVPPDYSRKDSYAGPLTCMVHDYYGERLTDVLPALGTHLPMSDEQLDAMFPTVPRDRIRVHDWRNEVVSIGEVPSEFVHKVTEGIYDRPWPAQLNRMVFEGGHDLILSLGQVVPHEVIGMANYNKNLFVGTGGSDGINESHFVGAAYGMERVMGRADTPLRKILNYAEEHFCAHLPIVYVQTVISAREDGSLAVRGMYVGDDPECFERAAELSRQVNFTQLDKPLKKVVVHLNPEKFESTWLGNKSIYRTRMAIADGGELIVLGPGVERFGEDDQIDLLIRKYGYRTTPEIMELVKQGGDLANNLATAAHLVHGTSENRFQITYCPGKLTREETEGVGYQYAELDEMLLRYDPTVLKEGPNVLADGEEIYFISRPELGLWACRERLEQQG